MNEKKLYKVTITDENGKVVHEVESDCIIAAISDPSKGSKEQSAIHGVYMTNRSEERRVGKECRL